VKKKPAQLLSVIDITKSFNEAVSEIEVLHAGEWEHPTYGTIKITEQDIDTFIANFDSRVRKVDIAVDQEHRPQEGAAGWFKKLKKKINAEGKTALVASVAWTKLGTQLIKDGIFKYFSPEFSNEYEDLETHDMFSNVLLGGALTNRPYFKSLAPVQLSENLIAGFVPAYDYKSPKKGGSTMKFTLEELKAKLAEDPKFVLSGEQAADAEQVKLFDEAVADLAKDAEEKATQEAAAKAEAEKAEADKAAAEAEAKAEAVKASEGVISVAEHTRQMNELKSRMGIVEKQLREKEVAGKVSSFVFSASNQDGVLLPKNADKASEILMNATPKVAKLFEEFMAELPKVSAKLFKEEGASDGETVNAEKLIEEKTKAGMKYSEAVKAVGAEHPELFKGEEE